MDADIGQLKRDVMKLIPMNKSMLIGNCVICILQELTISSINISCRMAWGVVEAGSGEAIVASTITAMQVRAAV